MDIAIQSRRQAIKRRMAELDRLSTSDARALDKAMTEMCALYAEYARSTVALVAFEAYRTLVERTPEDTGRARASWNLNAEPSDAVPPAGDYPEFRRRVGRRGTSHRQSGGRRGIVQHHKRSRLYAFP